MNVIRFRSKMGCPLFLCSLFLSISLCFSLCVCVCVSLSLSVSLSFSLSPLSLSVSVSVSVSPSLCVSLSVCLSLPPPPLSLSLSLLTSVAISPSLFLSSLPPICHVFLSSTFCHPFSRFFTLHPSILLLPYIKELDYWTQLNGTCCLLQVLVGPVSMWAAFQRSWCTGLPFLVS